MSSKPSEKNTEVRGKARDDVSWDRGEGHLPVNKQVPGDLDFVGAVQMLDYDTFEHLRSICDAAELCILVGGREARYVKVRKALIFLFAKGGLKQREIRHEKDDEVAVKDIVESEFYKPLYSAEDFEHAVAKDIHDLILKEEPHLLLVTINGSRVVKYHKEPLEYKERADVIPLNDGVSVGLSKESVAEEKVTNDKGPEKHEEKEEKEQRNESASGSNKKKKSKKGKAGTSGSQDGANKNQSKKEDEESPVPSAPVAKEPTASTETETKAEIASSNNNKHPFNATDSNPKSHQSKETIAEGKSAKSASEVNDQVLEESSAITSDDGFCIAGGKKGSKKSPDKKGNQSEASGKKKNSGNDLKQNKNGKQAAGESAGKAGKQTEKSKQTKDQKVNEPKQNSNDKQKTNSENLKKKTTEDVNSAALSSDEEKTSASTEEPPKKKQKNKPEDRPKKIASTFKYLFDERDGIKEKNIKVEDGGFVRVKAIIESYQSQYEWTEDELTAVLGNNEDYIFKQDDTGDLLVKAAEKKSEAVDQQVEMDDPGDGESWKGSGRRKDGQEDRKERPLQNSGASRSPGVGAVAPDKLRGTLFRLLERDGAAKNSIKFQPGRCLYVDEILNKVSNLEHVSVSDIKAAAESDPRKQFIIEETKGQMTIRFQENRTPRDRNSDFAGKSDFHLSKTMSFILRHGAERLQLAIQPDGFMFVDDLLSQRDLRSYKEEDVRRVVRDNDKQRFLIAQDPTTGRLKVRANQGHTFVVPDLELQPITSANDAPTVVHGTYHNSWKIIKEQGLSRMSRNHIHFAVGEPGSDGVISGMRGSCDVLVFIDMQAALNDGIKFFRSANNVILSPGDDKGIVSPKYFKTVVQRSPRVKLM